MASVEEHPEREGPKEEQEQGEDMDDLDGGEADSGPVQLGSDGGFPEDFLIFFTEKFLRDLRLDSVTYPSGCSPEFLAQLQSLEDKQAKFELTITRLMGRILQAAVRRELCVCCWLPRPMCMRLKAPSIHLPHHIYIVTHYREFGRRNNTARFLLHSMPENAHLRFWEFPDHARELVSVCERPNTCILFPSQTAQLMDQWLEEYSRAASGPSSTSSVVSVNIIVIDGTWPQAFKINKFLPTVTPRVKLVIPPTYQSLRKQTKEGRVSTVEAVSILLRALGVPEANCSLLDEHIRAVTVAHAEVGGHVAGNLSAWTGVQPRQRNRGETPKRVWWWNRKHGHKKAAAAAEAAAAAGEGVQILEAEGHEPPSKSS